MRILIIEDEPKLATSLKKGLEQTGYTAEIAFDGEIGEKLVLRNEYDLVLLDVIIPRINGLELCKKIRQVKPTLPILMLTALGTTDDKILGLDAGADDYLIKPFEFAELFARIRALTRRGREVLPQANTLKVGDLELDMDQKIATRGAKRIDLTAKEFALLEYFMKNKGRVLSRLDIAEHVWNIDFDTGTNVVDVYINILRKKIDRDFPNKLIHTRIGLGYVFKEL